MLPSATDAYNSLQSFNSSRPAASTYTDQANQQYGVGAATNQVSGLQSSLGNLQNAAAAVAPSVAGRTSGTFTTQAQRDALVNREQAPINGNINSQNQALGQAQSSLTNAEQMAQQMASSLSSQDQTKYQSLLDQYNAANSAQQFQAQQQAAANAAAEQARQYNASLAEQMREFNLTPHGTSNSAVPLGLGSSAAAAAAPKANMSLKGSSGAQGYNFSDSSGKALSAASYAQTMGIPLGTVLKQMAASGDQQAASAYGAIQSHPNLTSTAMNNIKKVYSSLFWGS